jgi:hypothetical protein
MNGLTNTGSRSMILNVGPVELVLTILIAVMPPSPIVLPECDALALPFDSAECEALAATERRCRVAFQGSEQVALVRRISADANDTRC